MNGGMNFSYKNEVETKNRLDHLCWWIEFLLSPLIIDNKIYNGELIKATVEYDQLLCQMKGYRSDRFNHPYFHFKWNNT